MKSLHTLYFCQFNNLSTQKVTRNELLDVITQHLQDVAALSPSELSVQAASIQRIWDRSSLSQDEHKRRSLGALCREFIGDSEPIENPYVEAYAEKERVARLVARVHRQEFYNFFVDLSKVDKVTTILNTLNQLIMKFVNQRGFVLVGALSCIAIVAWLIPGLIARPIWAGIKPYEYQRGDSSEKHVGPVEKMVKNARRTGVFSQSFTDDIKAEGINEQLFYAWGLLDNGSYNHAIDFSNLLMTRADASLRIKGSAHFISGAALYCKSDYKEALVVLKKAEETFQQGSYNSERAKALALKGVCATRVDRYDLAENSFNEAKRLMSVGVFPNSAGYVHQALADSFYSKKKYAQALEHCNLSIGLYESANNQMSKENAISLKVQILCALGDLGAAKKACVDNIANLGVLGSKRNFQYGCVSQYALALTLNDPSSRAILDKLTLWSKDEPDLQFSIKRVNEILKH